MKGLTVLFSFFVILLYLQLNSLKTQSIAYVDGNKTDHLALLAFKAMINPNSQRALSSWNASIHFCRWEGVVCGKKHTRVAVLDLQSKGLVGSLSPYIGNMSFLREIKLQNNTLHGKIPSELGRLFRLQILNVGNNSLEGEIPSNLSYCLNLQFLRLSYNKLVGLIPVEITSFPRLVELWIHNNHLTGGIPSSIANLSSLEILSASDNFLGGNIPDTLGQLSHLSGIGLGRSNLSGRIPSSIYNISSISIFSMPYNSLVGDLPSNIGLLLPNLQFIQLSGNLLTGSLPVSLSNATKLDRISLGRNKFTGKVAVNFGGMRQLVLLILAENSFGSKEGNDLDFITSLTNCTSLLRLYLSSNQLKGVLPNYMANLSTTLEWLSISDNQIYGSFPPGLSNLVSLSTLSIEQNHITGAIPIEFGMLGKLQKILLNQNSLSGQVPPSVGNLSLLNELQLQQNQLQGTIPSGLGNCLNLLFLNLSQNKFSSFIPEELFAFSSPLVGIDLSQNHLIGALPQGIGNLFHLNALDISQNMLSGQIPSNLGKCSSLEFLYLDRNTIQGIIPTSLAPLTGLRKFDVSQNNLSGEIPDFLEKLALEYLDLSYNNFEGKVPSNGVFSNKPAISVEGNKRLCGGIPELGLPGCLPASKKQHSKQRLVKIVVIIVSFVFGISVLSTFLYYRFRKTKSEQPPESWQGPSIQRLSYENILKATDGFSSTNLIGVGSLGSVYKGILHEDGAILAVKVLNLQREGSLRSFLAECKALSNIRHRNLLKIITACSSIDFQGNDFKAIIYEYMPNGSLEQWLHPKSKIDFKLVDKHRRLNFPQRISIAIDVGNALQYLHRDCDEPIIHCDLKPSNVLLDSDMVAHVGDFGLVKFLSQHTTPVPSSSIGVRGTIGYTPPEYGLGSEVSTSGDVYSYGILLLEMMIGKRPTDKIFVEGHNIHNFATMALSDEVFEVVDPSLLQEDERRADDEQNLTKTRNSCKLECLVSVIKVGVACSKESPQERMDIINAVNELQSIRNNFMQVEEGSVCI